MNYSDEQFAELSKYEDNFRTAIQGNWARNIPVPELKRIRVIYEAAAKLHIPFNAGCGTCRLNLLKRAGKLYFSDKEARIAAANDKAAAEATKAAAETAKQSSTGETPAKTVTKSTKKPAKK